MSYKHPRTLLKYRIKGVLEFYSFCQKNYLTTTLSTRKLKKQLGVGLATINRISKSKRDRYRLEDNRRRRRGVIDKEKKDKIESLIQDNRYKGHNIKLDSLRYKYNIPDSVSNYTIIRALNTRDIRFYIAATKEEIDKALASQRVEFIREKLDNPFNINLKKTRFSDKLYIGYRYKENRHYILRKRGRKQRYYKDCLRQKEQRTKINKKKKDNNNLDRENKEGKIVYLQYCISYNFKSKLYQYKVPTNSNRKINSKVYIERVLS